VDEPSPDAVGTPEPESMPRPARSRWGRAIVLAVVLAIAGIVASVLALSPTPPVAQAPIDAGPEPLVDPPSAPATVVTVRGTILIELPVDEPAPLVDARAIGGDTTGAVEPEGTEGDSTGDETPPPQVPTGPPPAGSCRVRAWQRGVPVAAQVSCDATGAFELQLYPGTTGRVAFDLEVPGHLRAVVESDAPVAGIGRLPRVALGPAQTVSGIVTDSRGALIPELEITARPIPDLGEPEPWRARSDAAGKFVFDTVPPGPVVLRVDAPGFAPTVLEVIASELDVQLVVDRLYELSGEVMGPPDVLARTRVRVEGSAVWPAREVGVDSKGFRFAAIPEGSYALIAFAPATRPGEPEFASIPLEDVAPDDHVTLALVPAHRVHVRVVDPDDAPIVGARVTLGASHLGLLQHHAVTDAQGIAAVGPVPNGSYVVHADADGFLPATGAGVSVVDAAPEPVVLQLRKPGAIRGIVVDEDDRRVAEASIEIESDVGFSLGEATSRRTVFDRSLVAAGSLGVTSGEVPAVPDVAPDRLTEVASRHAVTSDADGAFVIEGLVPGRYSLRATHGRFAASDLEVVRVVASATAYDVRLRLRRGHALTGRLVDGNGRPIADGWVELDDGSVFGTDDRGVFDAGLRRGSVVIVARAHGMAAHRHTLEMGGRARDVEIELAQADAIVRGHVVDDNLRPLGGVRVTMRPDSALHPSELAWTDDRGEFTIAGVAAGGVALSFDDPGHAPRTIEAAAVARSRERAIEIVLTRGWRLVVDVRDRETGVAIPDAGVTVAGRRATTDRTGVVAFDTLAEDEVAIEVRSDEYGRATTTARRQGDEQTAIVELRAGGSVEGIVTDWAGDPVAGATVTIRAGDEVVAELRTDARGRFDASGIPEGDIVLEAAPPDDRADDLAAVALTSDVLRGRTTRGIDLRLDRR
jgi:protocatechuate 3,4-dioxygenase beta subunit